MDTENHKMKNQFKNNNLIQFIKLIVEVIEKRGAQNHILEPHRES